MKNGTLLTDKQTVMKVSVISSIGLAMLLGSATPSRAQQQQGSRAKCSCICFVDTGPGGSDSSLYISQMTYNSNGISCGAFDNKTCNIDVPGSGIRSGRLDGCRTATSTGAGRGITILPHGSATLATTDSKPPKTTTPKVPVTGTTTQRR